jgi:uncharacterized protein YndB with AHSA1/START domain
MTDGRAADTATADGIDITRVFDAPRELVFRAWTEPERFAHWFGGPESEVPVSSVAMDVRPGGKWTATMFAGPERREIPWSGEFREVVAPERLAFTIQDRPGDQHETCTVVLNDLGGGRTEMVFHQDGGQMDAAGYDQARAGWQVFFDVMQEDVAQA